MDMRRFRVQDLFGRVSHEIEFAKGSPITIVAGPNGVGKTQLLKLLHGMLSLDFHGIAGVPFGRAELSFANGSMVELERDEEADDGSGVLRVAGIDCLGERHDTQSVPLLQLLEDPEHDELPPWLEQRGDSWYDHRLERYVPKSMIERRYGVRGAMRGAAMFPEAGWLIDLIKEVVPILVDTRRLDNPPARRREGEYAGRARNVATARIRQYADQVRSLVTEARRDSLLESQRADELFASRALKRARTTIREGDLKRRYEAVAELHRELHRNGLATGAMGVEFPASRTNPTERRILNVFVDDWERRLRPLVPLNTKLKTFKKIVNEKLLGKSVRLSDKGELIFITDDGQQISVEQLSSGEQHLVAIFTMLLFSTRESSIVLIDEPEISLHAAWKHAFLSDIEDVARLADVQVLLATHSSALINGRWELVRELEVGS